MSIRRLLITGDTGLLGSAIAGAARRRFLVFGMSRTRPAGPIEWNHRSIDLFDERAIERCLDETQPQAIVHCAAATNVEECEQEPGRVRALNVGATERLACWAAQSQARFVYISTDSVFDGLRGGYAEDDLPAPLNQYASSKAEGEKATLQRCRDALILRTNFVGRNRYGKPNVGKWMHERLAGGQPLPAFSDVRFSPLFVEDLAGFILELLVRGARGTFHVAARDSCTKYEFAQRFGIALRVDTSRIKPVLLKDAGFRAMRPTNTSLCVRKCEEFLGRSMPSVEEGIAKFVKALADSNCGQFVRERESDRSAAMNVP